MNASRSTILAQQALAAALSGARQEALQALAELPTPDLLPESDTLVAAGSAWLRLGEPAAALPYLTVAVDKFPDHPLGEARLGATLLTLGNVQQALPHLEKAVTLLPASGGALLNLARARLLGGETDAALRLLDQAADKTDKDPFVYRRTRIETLLRLERREEAEKTLMRQAVEAGEAGASAAFATYLGSQGRHDEAGSVLREAREECPDDLQLLELAAEFAQIRGRFVEAGRLLDRALEIAPDDVGLWIRLATFAGQRLGGKKGREAANRALALTADSTGPQRALALCAHAQILGEEQKLAEAEAAYREALALMPNCPPGLSGLGQLFLQLGRVEAATALFAELKRVAPLQGWSQLIQAREVPDDPQILTLLADAARRPTLEGPVQSHLLFTLAAAWEKKQDYARAWSFAAEANQAARDHLPYRPEVHRARVDREIARFSAPFMASRAGYGSDSRLPVFILGMPRSGTTLVEQILGSHSQVFGAGELSLIPELIHKLNAWEQKLGSRRSYPECIDDLSREESQRFAERHLAELRSYAPAATRIVDKLPHNFEHVGLIKLLFPNARILHLQRDPRDVAISNYFVDYAAKFGGMGFAYDLTWIGEQLVDHQRLMAHWHRVFPGEILEVDYDLLVEDVEGWAQRIIAYLDLPWEAGVLSFQQLDRAVKTASVWQVRQPVYTTSKAKWRCYAAHLAPLEAALAAIPPPPEPLPLPALPAGLFLAGMAELQADRPQAAEAAFRQLLAARPAHAAAQHFLGAALFRQGKFDAARSAMRRSLELHRGHRPWLENLLAVERARGDTAAVAQLRRQLENSPDANHPTRAAVPDRPCQGAA